MNDWIPDRAVVLLVRVTIILSLGMFALRVIRNRRSSVAIVIARAMLVARWVGPLQRLQWLKTSWQETGLSIHLRWLARCVCLCSFLAVSMIQPMRRVIAAPQPPTKTASPDQKNESSEETKPEVSEGTQAMLALGLLTGPIVWGDKPLEVDWSNMRKLPVTVLDENNQPLKNASVTLGTLSDEAGKTASLAMVGGMQTDDRGIAQVLIPGRTARVGLNASAPGYATQREDFNTTGKIEFRLKLGRTITVRATDMQGKLLPDAFPLVQKYPRLGP